MAYRPRFSIFTSSKRLRFPMAWTPMMLHEDRDNFLRSVQLKETEPWWQPERKYLKRLHTTWHTIRAIYHKRHNQP